MLLHVCVHTHVYAYIYFCFSAYMFSSVHVFLHVHVLWASVFFSKYTHMNQSVNLEREEETSVGQSVQ